MNSITLPDLNIKCVESVDAKVAWDDSFPCTTESCKEVTGLLEEARVNILEEKWEELELDDVGTALVKMAKENLATKGGIIL